MKIWKAELILCSNIEGNYDIRFEFHEQKEEYELNEKHNEWFFSEGWISRRIPMNMTTESNLYSVIKVAQGFDRELNEDELKQLEDDMKKTLIEKINAEKDAYLQMYQMKIDIIESK